MQHKVATDGILLVEKRWEKTVPTFNLEVRLISKALITTETLKIMAFCICLSLFLLI